MCRKEKSMTVIEHKGDLFIENKRFCIVVSRFNQFITEKLVAGAIDALTRSGIKESEIEIIHVPGSFEIPIVAKRALISKRFDAIICLGTVIRGETPHFDYVANEVSKGIAQLGIETGIPVMFGIITADSTDQAIERAGNKMGNKGFSTAQAAIELLNLFTSAKI